MTVSLFNWSGGCWYRTYREETDGGMEAFDYAVIGAGVEGSAAAYYLAKNGHKTVLLDQFPLGHDRGSSHGASRITRKAYDEPIYVDMMQRAYQLWAELEAESGERLFKKTGLLCLDHSVDGRMIRKVARSLAANSSPYTVLDARQIREMYPHLKYDSRWRGLLDPEAGVLMAERCLDAFQRLFSHHGGTIRDADEVISVNVITSDRLIIRTRAGVEYECKGAIVCLGAWARDFLKEKFGLRLPLQPHAVKSCYWKVDHPELYSSDKFPCILSTTTDEDEPSVTNGDYMYEFYGLPSIEDPQLIKFSCHTGRDIDRPSDRDSEAVRLDSCIEKPRGYIERHFDGVRTERPAKEEICMYTVTPDNHFVLDRHPNFENVAIGAGFSGMGSLGGGSTVDLGYCNRLSKVERRQAVTVSPRWILQLAQ